MLPDSFWRAARLAIGKSAQDWHWARRAGELDGSFLPTACFSRLPVDCSGSCWRPLAMRALIAFLPRNTAANALQANVDTRLLLFAFLVSLATGFLAGCAPALQAGRKSLISSLRERGGTAFGGLSLRRGIVTAQIAFTLILVVAAGLFVRTLSGLLAKGPGFDTSSLISFGIEPALKRLLASRSKPAHSPNS